MGSAAWFILGMFVSFLIFLVVAGIAAYYINSRVAPKIHALREENNALKMAIDDFNTEIANQSAAPQSAAPVPPV